MNHTDSVSELLNANALDGDRFYNIDGKPIINKPTPAQMQQATNIATTAASLLANRQRNVSKDEVKAACGRKPIFNGHGKKDNYQNCVDTFLKNKALASAPAPTYNTPTSNTRDNTYYPPAPQGKKFLGMPIGVGITVSIIAAAGISLFVWKVVLKK